MRAVQIAVVLVTLVTASGSALAQRHGYHGWGGPRVGIGIDFSFPLYGSPYYYPPYSPYYYSSPVEQAPPVYIEQGNPSTPPAPQSAPTQSSGSWYYCDESKAYYPYVRECPGGWQSVSPTPPPG